MSFDLQLTVWSEIIFQLSSSLEMLIQSLCFVQENTNTFLIWGGRSKIHLVTLYFLYFRDLISCTSPVMFLGSLWEKVFLTVVVLQGGNTIRKSKLRWAWSILRNRILFWNSFYDCCVYLDVLFNVMTSSSTLWNISGCCCVFLIRHHPINRKFSLKMKEQVPNKKQNTW